MTVRHFMSSHKTTHIKIKPVGAAFVMFLLAAAMMAQAATIQCPRSITEKPAVASPPSAWVVVAESGPRSLSQAGISIKIGSEYGAQVPDAVSRARREEHVNWTLPPAPAAERYWLGCSYLGTTAMLVVKLEPTDKSCVAIYELVKTGKRQRLKTVDCV